MIFVTMIVGAIIGCALGMFVCIMDEKESRRK